MGSSNSGERPGGEEVTSARLHVKRSQVISGCVRYYFSENELDPQRVEILENCKNDLEALLPGLSGESWNYFSGLHTLASLLLDATPGR
jgi:hypothetical protein